MFFERVGRWPKHNPKLVNKSVFARKCPDNMPEALSKGVKTVERVDRMKNARQCSKRSPLFFDNVTKTFITARFAEGKHDGF